MLQEQFNFRCLNQFRRGVFSGLWKEVDLFDFLPVSEANQFVSMSFQLFCQVFSNIFAIFPHKFLLFWTVRLHLNYSSPFFVKLPFIQAKQKEILVQNAHFYKIDYFHAYFSWTIDESVRIFDICSTFPRLTYFSGVKSKLNLI